MIEKQIKKLAKLVIENNSQKLRLGINKLKKLFATRANLFTQNVGIFFIYLSRLSTNRFG